MNTDVSPTTKSPTPTCQMTVSDHGSFNGVENYWTCGKPAKFTIVDSMRGKLFVCGVHARTHDITAKRYGREPAKPIEK